MSSRIGIGLFVVGVLLFHMNVTFGFLWLLSGLPLNMPEPAATGAEVIVPGFITAAGALMMLAGGLVYGLRSGGES